MKEIMKFQTITETGIYAVEVYDFFDIQLDNYEQVTILLTSLAEDKRLLVLTEYITGFLCSNPIYKKDKILDHLYNEAEKNLNEIMARKQKIIPWLFELKNRYENLFGIERV